MAIHVGSLREVCLTKESVRGTAESPASGTFIRHYGHTFLPKASKVDHVGADGTIVQNHAANIHQEVTEGGLPWMLEVDNAYLIAHAICGQNPSTSGSDPYTHAYTFLGNSNTHQSFTVSHTDPTSGDKASALGMLNSLTTTVVPNQYIEVQSNWMAKKEASASFSPSYVASPLLFLPKQITLKFATNYAGLGAASETVVSNFAFTATKNCAYVDVDGSTEPHEIVNQRSDIRGEITLPYDGTTFKDLGLSDNTRAMSVNISDGTYSITMELPTVNWRDWAPDSDNEAYVNNKILFVATNQDATNGFVKFSVVDRTATH